MSLGHIYSYPRSPLHKDVTLLQQKPKGHEFLSWRPHSEDSLWGLQGGQSLRNGLKVTTFKTPKSTLGTTQNSHFQGKVSCIVRKLTHGLKVLSWKSCRPSKAITSGWSRQNHEELTRGTAYNKLFYLKCQSLEIVMRIYKSHSSWPFFGVTMAFKTTERSFKTTKNVNHRS